MEEETDNRDASRALGVRERLAEMADEVQFGGIREFATGAMLELIDGGLSRSGVDEGTLWLADATRGFLVPVYNNGPHAEKFIGHHQQSLSKGIISSVYATESIFWEDEVYRNAAQDATLDQSLGVLTCSMVAAPFYFAGRLRGVLSAVRLKSVEEEIDPPPLTSADAAEIRILAGALQVYFEHRLMEMAMEGGS